MGTGIVSPRNDNKWNLTQQFEGLFTSPSTSYQFFSPPGSPTTEYYNYATYATQYQASYAPEPCRDYYNPTANFRSTNTLPRKKLHFQQDYYKPKKNSKSEAVNSCLMQLQNIFGDKIDEAGFRGPTSLRIRVKTWTAITHIVPFLCKVHAHIKVEKVSFPKSTKGLGRILRGFLAYVQVENLEEREKMQKLFDTYQADNKSPFKKLEITTK